MSIIISQLNIAKRIVGVWLRKGNRLTNVRLELVDAGSKCWEYKLNAYGYNIDLYIHTDGRVYSRLWCYGTIGATSSTIAGFCSLIKNCARWSNNEGK